MADFVSGDHNMQRPSPAGDYGLTKSNVLMAIEKFIVSIRKQDCYPFVFSSNIL